MYLDCLQINQVPPHDHKKSLSTNNHSKHHHKLFLNATECPLTFTCRLKLLKMQDTKPTTPPNPLLLNLSILLNLNNPLRIPTITAVPAPAVIIAGFVVIAIIIAGSTVPAIIMAGFTVTAIIVAAIISVIGTLGIPAALPTLQTSITNNDRVLLDNNRVPTLLDLLLLHIIGAAEASGAGVAVSARERTPAVDVDVDVDGAGAAGAAGVAGVAVTAAVRAVVAAVAVVAVGVVAASVRVGARVGTPAKAVAFNVYLDVDVCGLAVESAGGDLGCGCGGGCGHGRGD